jgi:hypothetical protein
MKMAQERERARILPHERGVIQALDRMKVAQQVAVQNLAMDSRYGTLFSSFSGAF